MRGILLAALLGLALSLTACGGDDQPAPKAESPSPAADAETAKVLGQVRDALAAGNQEPFNSLKSKVFELPLAIVNPDLQLIKDAYDGKISVAAYTPLESISVSGPQRVILMLTPQQAEEIRVEPDSPLVWGRLKAELSPALDRQKSLVFGLAPNPAEIGLLKEPELWAVTPAMWEGDMRQELQHIVLAMTGYWVDTSQRAPGLDALYDYGYRRNPALGVEITPAKTEGGQDYYLLTIISPDGRYKMIYDSSIGETGARIPGLKAVPVE